MSTNSDERIVCTPTATAKSAFFYLIEMGRINRENSCAEFHHAADSLVFAAIIEGSGILTYGDEEYKFSKGDCFFIDCRIPHSYKGDEIILLKYAGFISAVQHHSSTTTAL